MLDLASFSNKGCFFYLAIVPSLVQANAKIDGETGLLPCNKMIPIDQFYSSDNECRYAKL